jgi:hypothetical protein
MASISDDVVKQAIKVADDAIKHGRRGEWDINGIGIKAGVATYKRWYENKVFGRKIKIPLPNNHSPYVGIRIAKPLPPPGTPATVSTV